MKIRISEVMGDEYLVALQVEERGPIDLFRVKRGKPQQAQEPMGLVEDVKHLDHQGFDVERRFAGSDRRAAPGPGNWNGRRASSAILADPFGAGRRGVGAGRRRQGYGSGRRRRKAT